VPGGEVPAVYARYGHCSISASPGQRADSGVLTPQPTRSRDGLNISRDLILSYRFAGAGKSDCQNCAHLDWELPHPPVENFGGP